MSSFRSSRTKCRGWRRGWMSSVKRRTRPSWSEREKFSKFPRLSSDARLHTTGWPSHSFQSIIFYETRFDWYVCAWPSICERFVFREENGADDLVRTLQQQIDNLVEKHKQEVKELQEAKTHFPVRRPTNQKCFIVWSVRSYLPLRCGAITRRLLTIFEVQWRTWRNTQKRWPSKTKSFR